MMKSTLGLFLSRDIDQWTLELVVCVRMAGVDTEMRAHYCVVALGGWDV